MKQPMMMMTVVMMMMITVDKKNSTFDGKLDDYTNYKDDYMSFPRQLLWTGSRVWTTARIEWMMMMTSFWWWWWWLSIISITKMITIVVKRVSSLDDGSERVGERPRFKSWLSRCSPTRYLVAIIIIINISADIIQSSNQVHTISQLSSSSSLTFWLISSSSSTSFIIQTSSSTTHGSTSRPPSKCRCVLVWMKSIVC